MNVQLVWATPNAEEMITRMARVSAPKNQDNMDTAPKLLRYLIKHQKTVLMICLLMQSVVITAALASCMKTLNITTARWLAAALQKNVPGPSCHFQHRPVSS